MFELIMSILLIALCVLKRYTKIGFFAVQVLACFVWVWFGRSFWPVQDFAMYWILASLAALAVKTKEREFDD